MSIDKVNPFSAANAYSATQNSPVSGTDDDTGDTGSASGSGGDFGAMLQNAAKDTIKTLKGSEAMSAQAVAGKADLADVVSATEKADVTLQEVVSMRDKIISAYEEIERMSI